MDAVIVLFIVLMIVLFVKRTFSGFVYSIAMIDIFLRLLSFLNLNLTGDLHEFVNTYFPTSFPDMIAKYTNGTLETVLIWIYIIIMIIFEFYTVRIFFDKK